MNQRTIASWVASDNQAQLAISNCKWINNNLNLKKH